MPAFSFLTRTRAFKRLTKWAFKECDVKKDGKVTKNDFYAGMLLVHVQLAKYCGSAACYPPTRQVCDEIFDACDEDASGTIDEREFNQCMVVCCAQISSRIAVYYGVIIMFVPYLVQHIMQVVDNADNVALWLTGGGAMQRLIDVSSSYLDWSSLAKSVVSSVTFTLLIPFSFDLIDRFSRRAAEKTSVSNAKKVKYSA